MRHHVTDDVRLVNSIREFNRRVVTSRTERHVSEINIGLGRKDAVLGQPTTGDELTHGRTNNHVVHHTVSV